MPKIFESSGQTNKRSDENRFYLYIAGNGMFVVRSAIDLSTHASISNKYYFTRQGEFQIHSDGSIRDNHGGILQVFVNGKLQDASCSSAVLEWSSETYHGFIGRTRAGSEEEACEPIYGQRRPIISRKSIASDLFVTKDGYLGYYSIPEACCSTNVGKWTPHNKARDDNKEPISTKQIIALIGGLLNPTAATTITELELTDCWVGETVKINVRPLILTKQCEVLLERTAYDLSPSSIPTATIASRSSEWSWSFNLWTKCCSSEESEEAVPLTREFIASTCKP